MDFAKRTVIVTGGGSGIGKSCCMQFARKGANVVVADINEDKVFEVEREIKKEGFIARGVKTDVRSVESIYSMVEFAKSEFLGVDILVNNAGILHTTTIEDLSEAEWDCVMEINLKSVFFATQAVLPYMKENKYGKILNLSSLAGRNGGIVNGLAYTASKAGIIGLTRGFAQRLAEYQINVNALAPGSTDTGILKDVTQEKMAALMQKIPLGRLGVPEEIASVAVFLCSDQASFITGAVLDINGGMYYG